MISGPEELKQKRVIILTDCLIGFASNCHILLRKELRRVIFSRLFQQQFDDISDTKVKIGSNHKYS
jgi:hypothetical protein